VANIKHFIFVNLGSLEIHKVKRLIMLSKGAGMAIIETGQAVKILSLLSLSVL